MQWAFSDRIFEKLSPLLCSSLKAKPTKYLSLMRSQVYSNNTAFHWINESRVPSVTWRISRIARGFWFVCFFVLFVFFVSIEKRGVPNAFPRERYTEVKNDSKRKRWGGTLEDLPACRKETGASIKPTNRAVMDWVEFENRDQLFIDIMWCWLAPKL